MLDNSECDVLLDGYTADKCNIFEEINLLAA